MKDYNKIWRSFFAIAIILIAIQQVVVSSFMPVIFPPTPAVISGCLLCAWVVSILLAAAGVAILFTKYSRHAATYLGGGLLLLLLIFHLPYQIKTNLHFLGGWGNAFKILALIGGAFVVAQSLPTSSANSWTEKILPAGRYFFAITIIVFGIIHFLYIPFVAMLVPAWVPAPTFWAYFTGTALLLAGISIILNIKVWLSANLLGAMIFIWLVTLHIPRAIADPHTGNGNEVVSAFEALAFCGTAFLIASNAKKARA